MIRRHSRYAIFIHWFNAVCWLFLLFSGLGLLTNPLVQPIGKWWSELWISVLGSNYNLLNGHVIVGIVWLAVYALYLLIRFRKEAWPFLLEVFHLHPVSDMVWCMKKGMRLTIGEKVMRRMGMDPALPAQGFYNAGQKMAAIAAVLSSIGLGITGAIMVYFAGETGMEELLRWCMFIHFCCAGVMCIMLPVHIYMAAAAPGELPALRSMFTGFIPESFVKHHNPLWYAKLTQKKQAK